MHEEQLLLGEVELQPRLAAQVPGGHLRGGARAEGDAGAAVELVLDRGHVAAAADVASVECRADAGDRGMAVALGRAAVAADRKSTRLNSSHGYSSYAVFCLKKKKNKLLASVADVL